MITSNKKKINNDFVSCSITFAHFCQTPTSSWRQELSFPRPGEGCPPGTEISDCTRSPPVRCRCEPRGLATLLPTILKGKEMTRGSRWKLMFPRPSQGCPAGTQQGICTRSMPPMCKCEPDGVTALYSVLVKGETGWRLDAQ